MNAETIDRLDWSKSGGLLPAVVQHWRSGDVLMLGYMDAEALRVTVASGKVTFFSRSRQRLWTKGETSGNALLLHGWHADCDADALLIRAEPVGPTCHLGTTSCFGETDASPYAFLGELDAVLQQRARDLPAGSYSADLFRGGVRAIAQKVGEEGVETALAAVVQDDDALIGEAADLLFHLAALMRARGMGIGDAVLRLKARHSGANTKR